MSSPYSDSGKNGISVADAKAYIATIDPEGISDQITHYTNVAASLKNLATAISTINSNLQSTWSGSAADAANTQFKAVVSQTTTLATTLSDTVVPTLKSVYEGAQNAQKQIKTVQNEVTQVKSSPFAPLNSPLTTTTFGPASTPLSGTNTILGGTQVVSPGVASQASTPPYNMDSTKTYEQAVAFNTQQRTAAAKAMNAVAVPYSSTATTFSDVATGLSADSSTSPPSTAATAFTLTPSYGGSSSNGAANGYQPSFGGGGSGGTGAGGSTGSTKLQSYIPPPTYPTTTPPPPPVGTVPPASPPVVIPPTGPVVTSPPSGGDPVGDPPVGTTPVNGNPTGSEPGGIDPVTGLPIEGTPGSGIGTNPTAPGVFGEGGLPGGAGVGEGGLAGGTGSGIVPGGTSFGGPASSNGSETGVVGGAPTEGATGAAQGEQPGMGMMGGGMRGGGGGGGGSSSSGGSSASYLRGRYLGDEDATPGYASTPWESPAIGGSEGVLIGAQPAEGAGVTSVYAGAQDSQGNPVGVMGGGGLGGSRSYGEESEESGSRPGYVKEDPQWWTPEGSYVPPVVE